MSIRFSIFPALMIITLFQCSCRNESRRPANTARYLLLHTDTQNHYWYTDPQGDTIIRPGKYSICFTDTFRDYAVVMSHGKFIAINRNEQELYEVYLFDNGPDYPAGGLFRIKDSRGKIGYADSATGKIIIPPQFDGAFPFDGGIARVGTGCRDTSDGEHNWWVGGNWWYIDKDGKKVPAFDDVTTYGTKTSDHCMWLVDFDAKTKNRTRILPTEHQIQIL
ncbi:WG repeat-containing protein [Chitinophagaceae bacterium MMS25-I14]